MFIPVPLGTPHPNIKWGYYNRAGELVREVVAEDIPDGLQFVRTTTPDGPPGFYARDPHGEGYYVCWWVASERWV